jgi:hypothetical protein
MKFKIGDKVKFKVGNFKTNKEVVIKGVIIEFGRDADGDNAWVKAENGTVWEDINLLNLRRTK